MRTPWRIRRRSKRWCPYCLAVSGARLTEQQFNGHLEVHRRLEETKLFARAMRGQL